MQRFKIDGPALVKFYNTSTKLARVFSDIEMDLKSQNRVVCQYIINGKKIEEEDEVVFSEWDLTQVSTLEYLSEGVAHLVVDVVRTWIRALPEFVEQIEKLAEELRFEANKKSRSAVLDMIENCEYLVDSLIPVKSLMGDSVAAGLKPMVQAEEQTRKSLAEAIKALEKKNFVLLADIIEYELTTALQSWHQGLLELLPVVQESANKDVENAPSMGNRRQDN
ncbi:MAG: hypothetical protein AABY64_12440 [Bdellovibrionota bacterium]